MLRALCTSALAVVVSAGCGSGSSDTAAPATFSQVYPLIFPRATKAQCSFCHGLPPNEKSNGNLSTGMDQSSAYRALVGPLSTSAKCLGKPYVVPGKPQESLLLLKVTQSPACGDGMPLGGDPLTNAQVEMIRSWITAGALDD